MERVEDAVRIDLAMKLVSESLKAPEHPLSGARSGLANLCITSFSSSVGGRPGAPSVGHVAWYTMYTKC